MSENQGTAVVFRYIDVKQLTIGAKVVGILCMIGGLVTKYKYKVGVPSTHMTLDFVKSRQ
jgi:hypothetical protein